ncbi:MAG: lysylphosphatidylglycerol synthase transmembrane domain-containing protein [Phycisphaerae bacterium]
MTPRARRIAFAVLRWGLAALALWYLATQMSWGQFRAVLAQADWRWLALSMFALAPVPFLQALRLQWLMNANQIALDGPRATGITFAANFANFVLPGQTGGDLLKALFVARDTDRRHEAATVVLFDRVLGLVCVTLLSGAMLLANWRDPAVKVWGRSIAIAFVALLLPGILYFSNWFRRLIGWNALIDRLPLSDHIRRIDNAVLAYRTQRGAVLRCMLLTWLLQGFSIVATLFTGLAVNAAGSSPLYGLKIFLLYVPLCWMVGAVPIAPQGLGPVEWAYNELFHKAAGFGTAESATILSLLVRLTQLLWALPGVWFYIRLSRAAGAGRHRPAAA